MKHLLTFALLLLSACMTAQITWADDVADIVYSNCTSCHRDQGIAPFPLIDYNGDILPNANDILDAVATRYMPPWTADTEYQSYAQERVLSNEEIQTIVDWVNGGSLQGDPADAPPPPVFFDEGFITTPPDLELLAPEYTSNASSTFDDYVCFAIPTGLTEDKKLRGFEVIPGNTEIVHHCLVYIDQEADYETDLSGYCAGPVEGLIGGYTPGTMPTIFPSDGADNNFGVTIPAGSNLIFAMHYPNGSAGEVDQTKIRLFFYEDDTPIREVFTLPVLQDWDFTIPADEVAEVNDEFDFIPSDMSILSVFPHMHLIGEYIESYAVSPSMDTIPLVRIPHWDFDWQEFYFFQNLQHIPAFSTLYGNASYENLATNPHNPFNPPQDISAGLNTTDEMFLIYFAYSAYQDGDEALDIASMTQLPTSIESFGTELNASVQAFPNPFSEQTQLEINLSSSETVSIYIYDRRGQVVDRLLERELLSAGKHSVTWQAHSELAKGVYHYSINIGGRLGSGKLLLK